MYVHSIDDTYNVIILPKILFKLEKLESQIMEILHDSNSEKLNRIAINVEVSNYRVFADIKTAFAHIFAGSEISTTFHLANQIEVTNIEHINELLHTYHSSLLSGNRGFERMKNLIKKFFKWPTMNADMKKYIADCLTCEKTKIHRHHIRHYK